jgi:hypothetical protein
MAYQKVIVAPTMEQALDKAKEYRDTLDMVQQPWICRPYERDDGQWEVIVKYYGFD